jgi:hypothetical protein
VGYQRCHRRRTRLELPNLRRDRGAGVEPGGPNRLTHRKRDGFEEIVTRRKDRLVSDSARRVTRVEIGHPEGYLEAFANLYSDFARAVVARLCHKTHDEIERPFPTVGVA